MPRVDDLSECPLCFGRLLPLSLCHTCTTVAARDGLEEIGPDLACEDCGSTNPTHFVCSGCNARFPYKDIVKTTGPTCPVCRSPVPPGAELCPNCSAVLPAAGVAVDRPTRRIRGDSTEEDLVEVAQVPNVGRPRAEALAKAGFNRLWKIQRASEGELAKVKGVGPRNAAQVKDSLKVLIVMSQKKTKEEVLSEEYECPLCGTVTSSFASRCYDCGAAFDEEQLDEDFRKEVEREEEKGLLAYYDVRLLENPDDTRLHAARAALLAGVGRPAEALTALDRVLEIEPWNSKAAQAKARALAGAKGIGGAAQVLREQLAALAPGAMPIPRQAQYDAEEALQSLGEATAITDCPECGERQLPGAALCPVCGYRFAPEVSPAEGGVRENNGGHIEEERLLEELERAVAGEDKAPPPPLKPEVPAEVVAGKRSMLAFVANVPGVSKRAAEAVSGFFQDMKQIRLSDVRDLAAIPGVAPAEARLVKTAVDRHYGPEETPSLPKTPPARAPPPAPGTRGITAARPPAPQPEIAPPSRPSEKPPEPSPGPAPRGSPVTTRRPSGFEARRGLVNGKGLVNGRGRVNGLINGTGFINGGAVAELRLPPKRLMPRYITIGAAFLMLFAIAAALIEQQPPSPDVTIDGDFDDWSGIPVYEDGTASANTNVQIHNASIRTEDSTLFLRLGVAGSTIFADAAAYDSMYAFLDSDGDNATGYDLGDLGADYVVRVSGSNNSVEDARLLRFDETGRAHDDWSGFVTVVPVTAAAGGNQVEVSVPGDAMNPYAAAQLRVRFAFDDNEGETSHTEVPIAPQVGTARGSLRVEMRPQATTLGAGSVPFLRISFRSLGDAAFTVVGVTLAPTGGASFTNLPLNVNVPSGVTDVSHTIFADASGLPSETLVTAAVTAVQLEPPRPYTIVGPPAMAYVGQSPAGKQVDGLFDDWTSPISDTDGTLVRRPSMNILSREGNVSGNQVFLYARFAGPALAGTATPERVVKPPPPGQGGGTPAPAGPPPPLVGQDHIRFYVDTDAATSGGYQIGTLFADRFIEVRGRGGRVLEASVYQLVGQSWTRESSVDLGVGADEIEVRAVLPAATLNGTGFVAVTADWSGTADQTDARATRGTRGVEAGPDPPIVFDISGNGPFWFRDTNHATEIACTTNKVAKSVKGAGPVKQITLSTGQSACWYVDETTSQTIPAGSWETLLDITTSGGGVEYDVLLQIWNMDANTVAETVGSCVDITTTGDDVQCLVTGVLSKSLTSQQVVRIVIAHSFASGTVTIDYDDADSSGDSRTTLPIPEFSDIALPLVIVFVLIVVVRRRRRLIP
jgi:hypothetical protein